MKIQVWFHLVLKFWGYDIHLGVMLLYHIYCCRWYAARRGFLRLSAWTESQEGHGRRKAGQRWVGCGTNRQQPEQTRMQGGLSPGWLPTYRSTGAEGNRLTLVKFVRLGAMMLRWLPIMLQHFTGSPHWHHYILAPKIYLLGMVTLIVFLPNSRSIQLQPF